MKPFAGRGYELRMPALVLPGRGNYASSQVQGDDMKNNITGHKRRWYRGMITSVMVFLLAISLGLVGPAFSGDLRVVNGVVNRVSGKYIHMDGKQYDVAGVPVIMKNSRNRRKQVGIGPGDTVELSLRDGKIVSIRNYGPVLQ